METAAARKIRGNSPRTSPPRNAAAAAAAAAAKEEEENQFIDALLTSSSTTKTTNVFPASRSGKQKEIEFNAQEAGTTTTETRARNPTTTTTTTAASSNNKTKSNNKMKKRRSSADVELELTKLKLKTLEGKHNETESKFKIAQNRIERLCRILGELEKEKELLRLKHQKSKEDQSKWEEDTRKAIEEEKSKEIIQVLQEVQNLKQKEQELSKVSLQKQQEEEAMKKQRINEEQVLQTKIRSLEEEVVRLKQKEQEEAKIRKELEESIEREDEAIQKFLMVQQQQQLQEKQQREERMSKVAAEQQRQLAHIQYLETELETKSKHINALQTHIHKVEQDLSMMNNSNQKQQEGQESRDDDDDDDHDDEEYVCLSQERDMMILDMVIHLEDIETLLDEILGKHENYSNLNDKWRDEISIHIKNKDRAQWIMDEKKKTKTINEMRNYILELQDEVALVSYKSKDLHRTHHQLVFERKEKQKLKKEQKEKQNAATTMAASNKNPTTILSPPSIAMKSMAPIRTYQPNKSGLVSIPPSEASSSSYDSMASTGSSLVVSSSLATSEPSLSSSSTSEEKDGSFRTKTRSTAPPLLSDRSTRGRDLPATTNIDNNISSKDVSFAAPSSQPKIPPPVPFNNDKRIISDASARRTTTGSIIPPEIIDDFCDQLVSFRREQMISTHGTTSLAKKKITHRRAISAVSSSSTAAAAASNPHKHRRSNTDYGNNYEQQQLQTLERDEESIPPPPKLKFDTSLELLKTFKHLSSTESNGMVSGASRKNSEQQQQQQQHHRRSSSLGSSAAAFAAAASSGEEDPIGLTNEQQETDDGVIPEPRNKLQKSMEMLGMFRRQSTCDTSTQDPSGDYSSTSFRRRRSRQRSLSWGEADYADLCEEEDGEGGRNGGLLEDHDEAAIRSMMSFRGRLMSEYFDNSPSKKPWVDNWVNQVGQKTQRSLEDSNSASSKKYANTTEPPSAYTGLESTLGDLSYLRALEDAGQCRSNATIGDLSLIDEAEDEFRVSTTFSSEESSRSGGSGSNGHEANNKNELKISQDLSLIQENSNEEESDDEDNNGGENRKDVSERMEI